MRAFRGNQNLVVNTKLSIFGALFSPRRSAATLTLNVRRGFDRRALASHQLNEREQCECSGEALMGEHSETLSK